MILNGALARLGQFSDLKTTGSAANEVVVGWSLKPLSIDRVSASELMPSAEAEWLVDDLEGTQLRSIQCEIGFDAKRDVPKDPTQLNPELFSLLLRVSTRDADGLDQLVQLGISRAPDAGDAKLLGLDQLGADRDQIERVQSAASLNVNLDEESLDGLIGGRRPSPATLIGSELIHFLPQQIAISYNRTEDDARLAARAIFSYPRVPIPRMARVRNVLVPPSALAVLRELLESFRKHLGPELRLSQILSASGSVTLVDILESLRQVPIQQRQRIIGRLQADPALAEHFTSVMKAELGDEYRTAFVPLPPDLQSACTYMRVYFSQSIRYLGPLRDEPKALYPVTASADPMDVGLKGENTAAVLDLHKDRLIEFLPPTAFASPSVDGKVINRTLETAVTEWLKYLGVAERVQSIDQGKLGHELKVRIDQRSGDQDLTHVGVGVSQVLPILVMCLLAPRDTVLLFEQPELHLHPKVQTLLGDFFLSMALLKKQCIIETHSEYLINRLRFRAAAAESDRVSNQLTIYFVEKKEGKSHFRSIVVNEFGAIQDWPEGFFDQSQREAEETLKAAVRKKRHQVQPRTP